MKFKALVVFAVIFLFLYQNVYMQQKKNNSVPNPLAGKWETIHNPMEASSLRIEFGKNYSLDFMLTSAWHGTYKIEGTKLISSTYIPIYKKYKTDTTTVLIFSDTLVQTGKDKGQEIITKLVRKKGAKNNEAGILGTWLMKGQEEEHSEITYDTTGKFEVKNILRSFKGKYIIKSDTVMAISEGRLMFKNRFVLDKGNLRLYSPKQSGPMTFERVDK